MGECDKSRATTGPMPESRRDPTPTKEDAVCVVCQNRDGKALRQAAEACRQIVAQQASLRLSQIAYLIGKRGIIADAAWCVVPDDIPRVERETTSAQTCDCQIMRESGEWSSGTRGTFGLDSGASHEPRLPGVFRRAQGAPGGRETVTSDDVPSAFTGALFSEVGDAGRR